MLRGLLGALLGNVARLWLATLRIELRIDPELARPEHAGRPWVLALFHGKQWPLLGWRRRRPTGVMVSLSGDGAIQARALATLGFTVVRGSSSRGGARGLAALVRLLRRGDHDVAFAVDGPRGPYGIPKPGVHLAVRRSGAALVPMGSAIASGRVLARAWDRFAIAWPFTRVAVVLRAPLDATEDGSERDRLAAAIRSANGEAEAMLAASAAPVLRFPRFPRLFSHDD